MGWDSLIVVKLKLDVMLYEIEYECLCHIYITKRVKVGVYERRSPSATERENQVKDGSGSDAKVTRSLVVRPGCDV